MATFDASIITIGDELLIGQTIDTNSAFIAQELNKIGIWVRRRVAVGDAYDDIWAALDQERKYSKLVIITGGLGPTADDITKPLLCNYFQGRMIVDENVLAHVKYLFEKVYRRPGPILERNLRQAEVPDVCKVLHNARGSAPGMWFDTPDAIFISLPGVPHEMKGLMNDQVIPRLLQLGELPVVLHRTAFTAGMGESMVAERIRDFEANLPAHISLAYLPNYGMVKLRLTSKGTDKDFLTKEIDDAFSNLLGQVQDILVSDQDEGMEIVLGKLLQGKGKTMGTAESCTGGYMAHLITSIPGSSAYFKGSIVSYANEVKQNLLGVSPGILEVNGAVSEETVRAMVTGALEQLQTDYVVVTSGIMGPGGGTATKPVGLVWIGVGNKEKTEVLQINLRLDRMRNISVTAMNAMNLLRKFILTNS